MSTQPDITYVYPGHVSGPYGEKVTVYGSWEEKQRQDWITALEGSGYVIQAAAWVPTYESYTVSSPNNQGGMQTVPLNPMQFPTRATCDHLAALFPEHGAPLAVREEPWIVGGGPTVSNAIKRTLVFAHGYIEAWGLANLYTNNPEDKSGYAHDESVRRLTAAGWQG